MLLLALGIASVGCAAGPVPAAAPPRERPVWEQPGLAGAVRPEMGKPQPGDAAPDFELPIAGGGSLRFASLRGSWVVMHFTATWCPFCDAEVEHLGALAEAYKAHGVRVLLIDLKEGASHFVAYAKERVTPAVTALYDTTGGAAARYAPPRAQPSFTDRAQVMFDSTLIIDPEGVIRLFLLPDSAHFDPTFHAVRGELDRLLAVTPSPLTVTAIAPPPMTPGSDAALVVKLAILPGFHLMSDRPSRPSYVATEVHVDAPDGVTVGLRRYPAPAAFDLGERTIATCE